VGCDGVYKYQERSCRLALFPSPCTVQRPREPTRRRGPLVFLVGDIICSHHLSGRAILVLSVPGPVLALANSKSDEFRRRGTFFLLFLRPPPLLTPVQMTTELPDEIVFSAVANLTTCTRTTIIWMYTRPYPPNSSYPLVVTNAGVDQGGSDTPSVNMKLINVNATLEKIDWPEVNVPQGRYRLDFYASTKVLSSNVFAVTNGPNVSCLVIPRQPPIWPSSVPPPPPGTSSTSSLSTTPSTPVAGGSTVNKGVIAGSAIGGVGVLALIAALVLWVFRRRKSRARNATPTGSVPRTKGQGSRGLHNSSDSTGAILPNSPPLSEADSDPEKSAVAYGNTKSNIPIVAPTRSYSKSSTSSRRPASMTVQPSFESRETVQSRPPRIPRRSLDSDVALPNNTTISPCPPSSPQPRYPPDRTRRASRKPVPAYDESEFSSFGSNDIPLAGRSETSLGTKVYFITPDVPLDQRN